MINKQEANIKDKVYFLDLANERVIKTYIDSISVSNYRHTDYYSFSIIDGDFEILEVNQYQLFYTKKEAKEALLKHLEKSLDDSIKAIKAFKKRRKNLKKKINGLLPKD